MEFIFDFANGSGYWGIIGLLFLCGLGLPLPEDIILLAAGYMVYQGDLHFLPTICVSMFGVLFGDSTIFFIGKYLGGRWTKLRMVRVYFTPKRLAKSNAYFEKYGGKTIFIARFLPGVRAAAYFSAGLFNVNYLKFVILDGIAATISVPVFIYLALYFGAEIEAAIEIVSQAKTAMFAIGCVVLIGVVMWMRRQNKTQNNF